MKKHDPQDFARRIPESLKQKTGYVFFSGRTAFGKQSDLYILGINPGGGDPTDTPDTSLDSHVKEVLCNKKDDWVALKDDCWCGKCGGLPCTHFLQRNLRHLIKQAEMNPRDVPVSEVVFRTSRGLATLDGKYEDYADLCWPFHEDVIDKLEVRVVAVYGSRSGEYVRKRLNAHKQVDEFTASRGKKTFNSRTYRNADGLTVVTLWFPGNWNPHWTNPKTDPTGLVVNALKSQVQ